MTRQYPAPVPENELSLEEMLALPPLPRSFRYEIKKNEGEKVGIENGEEKGKQELEAAKKRLRDLAFGVK